MLLNHYIISLSTILCPNTGHLKKKKPQKNPQWPNKMVAYCCSYWQCCLTARRSCTHLNLHTSLCLCGFSLGTLSHKDMLVKFISDSKLVAGVNVTMNGCLSLCQPCNRLADTELSRVYPAPL